MDFPANLRLAWQTNIKNTQSSLLWIVTLGAALRFITLGRQSLWLDEGLSYWTANRPWDELILSVSHSFRPLYFLVLRTATSLGGSEWVLRLPSALAGIISVALLYKLCVELFDQETGLLAALILAFSPFHIWYSQEARMYALAAALVLASALFTVRGLRSRHPQDWLLAGTFQALALWTESAAVWWSLASGAATLLMARCLWRSARFWPFVGAQALAFILYIPALWDFSAAMRGQETLWITPATLTVVVRTLVDIAGSFNRTPLEARLVLLFLLTFAAVSFRAALSDAFARPSRYLLVACWLILPVGLSFTISQPYFEVPFLDRFFTPGRSIFLARNLITILFPFSILLARGLILSPPAWKTRLWIVLFLLGSFAFLGNAIPAQKEDYRSAAQVVLDRRHPGDLILFAPQYIEAPFAYYYHQHGLDTKGIPIDHFKDGVISGDQKQMYAWPMDAIREHRRVWLVTTGNSFHADTAGIANQLNERAQLVNRWEMKGVTLQLFAIEDE